MGKLHQDDFLVVTWRKKDLAYYGQKLQELGIPLPGDRGECLGPGAGIELADPLLAGCDRTG